MFTSHIVLILFLIFYLVVAYGLYRGLRSPLGKKYTFEDLLLEEPKQEAEKYPFAYKIFYFIQTIYWIIFFIVFTYLSPSVTIPTM